MRIACIYLPEVASQIVAWHQPSLTAERAPLALAGSLRPLAHQVEALTSGLADALGGFSRQVELGGTWGRGERDYVVYARVPLGLRGDSYAQRLRACCRRLGLRATVGIADDKFTAGVAASLAAHDGLSGAPGFRLVPRGGSAAFLAPQALAHLPITEEVERMLRVLGITTLGEFAALPRPSHKRGVSAGHMVPDLQALARGESATVLAPWHMRELVRERLSFVNHEEFARVAFQLADRWLLIAQGRGQRLREVKLATGVVSRSIVVGPDAQAPGPLAALLIRASLTLPTLQSVEWELCEASLALEAQTPACNVTVWPASLSLSGTLLSMTPAESREPRSGAARMRQLRRIEASAQGELFQTALAS